MDKAYGIRNVILYLKPLHLSYLILSYISLLLLPLVYHFTFLLPHL